MMNMNVNRSSLRNPWNIERKKYWLGEYEMRSWYSELKSDSISLVAFRYCALGEGECVCRSTLDSDIL